MIFEVKKTKRGYHLLIPCRSKNQAEEFHHIIQNEICNSQYANKMDLWVLRTSAKYSIPNGQVTSPAPKHMFGTKFDIKNTCMFKPVPLYFTRFE